LIEQTEWEVTVELDMKAPSGEFAVFLDDERIFSRLEEGKLPDPLVIIPAIRARLFGDIPTC
jgi:predicted Rdx family selenoprotein